MPEQLIAAHRAAAGVRARRGVRRSDDARAVVALAQGTAATAADAVGALTAGHLAVPFTVERGSELPAYVDEHTLVFAVSTNGETEEVLAAAAAARSRGGPDWSRGSRRRLAPRSRGARQRTRRRPLVPA